jgi:3-oxoacyl-[acyl-carrier protein] reductase
LVRRLVLVGTGPRRGRNMATLTPEAQQIFGATYKVPEEIWLKVHFTDSEASQAGGRAEKVAADLRAPDGPHALATRVRAIVGDRLDILVANAGISKAATIEETTVEDFNDLFAVNVRAPYFLVQQLLPTLCKDSSIVLLSSLAAHAAVGKLSCLRRHQECHRYAREALRFGPGRPRHPRQCRRVFLASDEARWITGDTLRVDGGSKL